MFHGTQAGEELARIVAGLDGTARARFFDAFLATISDPQANTLLRSAFDGDGRRRLLMAFASFRKSYNCRAMKRAMEDLIGWMYEASSFVAVTAHNAVVEFQQALAVSLKQAGSDVVAGSPLMHFDVVAPGLGGTAGKQATDLLGTVPLSRARGGAKTVYVVGSTLESKGEHGVKAGVEQLTGVPKRLAKGARVSTEHGTFVLGENLFLNVEDALQALGESAHASRSIAGKLKASSVPIVVSPLPEAVVKAKYGPLFNGPIRYFAHPVSRATMEKAAQGLAPHFQLLVTR